MRIRAVYRGLLGAAGLLTLAGSGCVGSLTLDSPDAGASASGGSTVSGSGGTGQGSGGDVGTGGMSVSGEGGNTGSGGIIGTGGVGTGGSGSGGTTATGGSTGSGGIKGVGGSTSTGGTTGTGGTISTGGSTGSGGMKGTGGSGGGGVGGSPAPTFSQQIHDSNILVVYCSGSSCHNPGSQRGVSFSSQSNAYSAVRNSVTPGNGAGSSFYMTVNNGSMPPGGPKLSAANLALIKAWIDAGAMNN